MLPSDPDGAMKKYERCAALQPEDYEHKMNVAIAMERTGRKNEADGVLDQLAPTVTKDTSAQIRIAMERADIYWAIGEPQKAEGHLKHVLELEPPPDMDRTAHVKLAAIAAGGEMGNAIWSWFGTGGADVKLLVLREALAKTPSADATYLIGRKLALGNQPILAVRYLTQALAGKPPLPPSIQKEAWRLKLEARFESGECNWLREEAKVIPDFGTVFRRRANEWLDRCAFEEKAFGGALVPADALR
jgi:tetratricopeptide (TPR) repeat protein